jgi:hypothetical protein
MAELRFKQITFRNGNPYEGGPCVLDDGTVVFARLDGVGPPYRFQIHAMELVDNRPKQPDMADALAAVTSGK